MNQRLKELSDQAREYARHYVSECRTYGYLMEYDEEQIRFEQKFAELIIADAYSVLENRQNTFKGSGDEYARGFYSGLRAAKNTFATQYGIEKDE